MLRVYLDQNKWLDLMRALNGDPKGHALPQRRPDGAHTMAAISRNHAIAPPWQLATERKWAHMFTQGGLAERFGRRVMSDLSVLTDVLVRASLSG